MIASVCPSCGHPLQVPEDQAGKTAGCPVCSWIALVSVQASSRTATLPPSLPILEGATLSPAPAADPEATLAPNSAPVNVPIRSPGAAVPGYEILSELGRGGMGVVYKARQVKLNRLVALKMILAGGHAGEADLARFRTEGEAIARLQHPNIVQVHEVGEHDGKPFFSLEFCAGGSLDHRLDGTPLPPLEAARLVQTLARAMQAAHEKDVIHRDLKPANVLLTEDGTLKITDFGLAKKIDEAGQTASGAIMGTPSYMAPEQAGVASPGLTPGESAVGPACDIYALGAILYELLTGRPPFKAATLMDTLFQAVSDEPVPPSRLQSKTPADLETICLKCLHKEAARRYESAAVLADDLRRFVEGRPIVARPVGRLERAAKWVRRNPVLAGMTAVVVLTLLAGTVVSTNFGIAARQQAELARQNEADAVARGKELVTANADLQRSRDDLETTLARSLLSPLALQGDNKPMFEPEWEALWKLASNRSGRLGYRFVEEASRLPVTSRQLCDRAWLALPAAVGLDTERRAEVEALLLARLDDPALGEEQKTDLALAASAWGGLGSSGAARTARQLTTHAIASATNNSLLWRALGLTALAARMEPRDAATALRQAMKVNRDGKERILLARGLAAVAARMEPRDAATTLVQAIKDPNNRYVLGLLAEGLTAVGTRLEARDAGQAATTLLQPTKDPTFQDFPLLARNLSGLAAHLEARDAAQAVTTLVQLLKNTKDRGDDNYFPLAYGLSALAARLEARDAAQAATTLVQAMKDTRNPVMPLPTNIYALSATAWSVSALTARMEPQDAATTRLEAATILVQVMKGRPEIPPELAEGLSALAARMEAREAAQVATVLLQAMQDPKHPTDLYGLAPGLSAVAFGMEARDAAQAATTLLQALKDTKDFFALSRLVEGLSALAARLEAREAAQVATVLLQAMQDPRNQYFLSALAPGLAAVTARLEPRDAGTTTAQGATILLQALKDTKDPGGLSLLVQALSALAPRLEAKDAMRAATTLLQIIKDTKDLYALHLLAQGLAAVAARMEPRDGAGTTAQVAATLLQALKTPQDPRALHGTAQGLAALAARMEARDAATTTAQAATILVQLMKEIVDPNTPWQAERHLLAPATSRQWRDPNRMNLPLLTQSLSALLSAVPPGDIPSRSASAAAAAAFSAGTGHPLTALSLLIRAAEPPPCRLSTQQLVELLKMPICTGESRRVVLDHLGNRYRRTFTDAWQFVRFAKEQDLDLDLTTSPLRPELREKLAEKVLR